MPSVNPSTQKIVVWIVFGLALAALGWFFRDELAAAQVELVRWIGAHPVLGVLAFIAVYAVSIPLLLPSLPFILAAGMLFGLLPGFVYAFVANTLGGLTAFLLARSNMREFVKRRIKHSDVFTAFDQAMREDGFKTAALLRMVPIVPGWLINYGLGLTAMKFKDYLLAAVGTVPVLLVYVFIGTSLQRISSLFTSLGAEGDSSVTSIVTMVAAIILAVLVIRMVTRRAMENLDHRRQNIEQEAIS